MSHSDPGRPATSLELGFGREAFGNDAANYHAARPPYPAQTWKALRDRAGLQAGVDIIEIGAGTGLATSQLLAHQPRLLVAVEPDARLAGFLRERIPDPRLEIVVTPFEDAELREGSFDLVASATVFHWLDAAPALSRVHAVLRPGGAVALWWNVFGGDGRPDPFHEATAHLFAGQRISRAGGEPGRLPHGLDAEARIRELTEAGFAADPPEFMHWGLTLDPIGLRRLYATYSNVAALPPDERHRLLDALADIASRRFAGKVERNLTTAIYTAHRV